MPQKVEDLTGQTFGELTVLRRAGSDHGATWVCLCSCGEECVKLGHKIVSGHTKTCGHSTAKTSEELREYKRDWAREHTGLPEGQVKENKNQNTDKTHCINEHELSGDNLVIKKTKEGEIHRICRICRNADARKAARAAEAKYRALKKSDPTAWEKERRRRREEALRRNGWTLERFETLLVEQSNLCAICKAPLDINAKKNGTGNQAVADHEHTIPPKPREVLCGNCNLGIGNLKENPEIMRAAIAYVEKWKV